VGADEGGEEREDGLGNERLLKEASIRTKEDIRSIPKRQLNRFTIKPNLSYVIFEYC
jgi:hypothetical protein